MTESAVVSLTKTEKKGRGGKDTLFEEVRVDIQHNKQLIEARDAYSV